MDRKLRLLRSIFLILGVFGLVACAGDPNTIEIDHRFSYNVAKTPSWFPPAPEEENLTPSQIMVIRKFGPPGFFRFWWRPDGEFITSSDFSGHQADVPRMLTETKRTWIYLNKDLEIEFTNDGNWLEHPVTDKVKLVCLNGDPSGKSAPVMKRDGSMRETWRWVDRGIIVEMIDGTEVKRRHFQGTGQGTYLGR